MNKISNDFLKKQEINHQNGQVIYVDSFMIKKKVYSLQMMST